MLTASTQGKGLLNLKIDIDERESLINCWNWLSSSVTIPVRSSTCSVSIVLLPLAPKLH